MRRLRLMLVMVVLLLAALSCVPAPAFAVPTVSPSLVGADHVSEGVLLRMQNGRLVHLFRIDPGLSGDHVGNRGQLAIRKSVNGGTTWGQTERVNPSSWDDRNFAAYVHDGDFEVVYRQYDASTYTGLALHSMNTIDSGWLWENTLLRLPLAAPGRTVVAPDGITEVPGRGWLGLLYNSLDGSQYALMREEGEEWDFSTARQLPVVSALRLSESALAHLGDQRVIAVFRNERRAPGYHVMLSEDDGESWSAPVRLSDQRYWASAPHVVSDPADGAVYLLAGERIARDGDEANRACAIVIYRSTCERLSADPTDWDYYGSAPRPWPSSTALYGYPTVARRDDGTHLVVFTERKRDSDGTEGANLFQFVLEHAEGNPQSPVLTASLPAAVVAAVSFRVTGRVVDATGAPLAGVECRVQRRTASGSWITVKTAKTGSDGTWAATCSTSVKAPWRVITPRTQGDHACGYGPVVVTPSLVLSRPSIPTTGLRVKKAYAVRGTVKPVRAAGPVQLVVERRTKAGWKVWRRGAARVSYKGSGVSTISGSLALPYKGSWRMRFEAPKNSSHLRSLSAYRYLTSR